MNNNHFPIYRKADPEQHFDRHDLALQAIEYIRKNRSVSWAELECFFDRIGFDYRGDLRINAKGCRNVVLWDGWNELAINVVNDVVKAGRVRKVTADELVYLLDGKGLRYPIVLQARPCKALHWLPLVFVFRETEGAVRRVQG